MGFLTGKRALIAGIASDRSIAWGIAQAMAREGAEIALTYQSERLSERVHEMAAEIDANICLPLDVSSDDEIIRMYESLASHWTSLDIIVHSVAFAPRDQLVGRYLDTVTREGSHIAHDISSYSFVAMAKYGRQHALETVCAADAVLSGCGALDPELQHHGPGQGQP